MPGTQTSEYPRTRTSSSVGSPTHGGLVEPVRHAREATGLGGAVGAADRVHDAVVRVEGRDADAGARRAGRAPPAWRRRGPRVRTRCGIRRAGSRCARGSNGGWSSARTTLRGGIGRATDAAVAPTSATATIADAPSTRRASASASVDGAAARDRPAVRDGDADEPRDRGDEEGEAGLDRECGVHDAERDAGEQQHRRRDDGGGRPPAAQGDGHGGGRRDQREEERRHQQGLVGADRHRDRHELLPRQRGAREEFDDALGRGDDADDGPARHGGGDAEHEVGAEHGDHHGPCRPPELRAGHARWPCPRRWRRSTRPRRRRSRRSATTGSSRPRAWP